MEKMKQIEEDMTRRETLQRDKIARMDRKEGEQESKVLQDAVTLHQSIKKKFDVVREINQSLEYANG